jgi:uncharacterized damage-inducible protein DinB
MFTGTYPTLMADYNRWMNQKVYAGCQLLSDDERKRDRGAFFKSIHGTLNHLVWGDRIWLGRFGGKAFPLPPAGAGDDLYADFAELGRARTELDQEIVTWAAQLTPDWLAEPMTWTSRLYGFTQTQPRLVLVVQMFNHQTHHRGQAHALLTAAGIDIGPTDIPVLPLLQD